MAFYLAQQVAYNIGGSGMESEWHNVEVRAPKAKNKDDNSSGIES
jgi:hypothetical protein